MKIEKKKREVQVSPRRKEILSIILKSILSTTAIIGLAATFSLIPNSPIALNFLFKKINQKRSRKLCASELKKIFEKMKKEQLIDIIEEGNELKVVLRRKGARIAIVNNLDNIKLEKPKNWDNKWRIIIFDIPEKYKKARDALSQKLRELNFYRLQKSIFVFPYPPYDVIDFLTEVFEISPYVRIIEATKIEGEKEILAHFELTLPA